MERKQRLLLLTASFCMLLIAFIQSWRITHDLTWPFDTDHDRDIAFIRNSLNGHFGRDPIYTGHYLWYNPLLFSIEAALVRLTGLPINIIVVRAGLYLDLLGPLSFFLMALQLFDLRIATASLLSYLFLACGDMEGSGAATYSPWLYPCTFTQCFFYFNMLLAYKAFRTQHNGWFVLLGVSTGVCFLGHTGPALLTILILMSIQAGNFLRAWQSNRPGDSGRLLLQGLLVFIPFIVVAMPILFFIAGKYHLQIQNHNPAEWRPDEMYWNRLPALIKENASVSLLVAGLGAVWFYRKMKTPLIRSIIFNWLAIAAVLYVYGASITGIRDKFHIQLPDTVPCYHYFFYLKALQSVFFGFGLLYLLDLGFGFIGRQVSVLSLGVIVLVLAIGYFPFYRNRIDFTMRRRLAVEKGRDSNRIAAYDYLVSRVPEDKVILCPEPNSTFPVMASGRKMVCTGVVFSNPYVDYRRRYRDDSLMLNYLRTGAPDSARRLFDDYQVSYVMIPSKDYRQYTHASTLLGPVLFQNDSLTLVAVNR
jgi:hypothetical protein